MTITKHATFPTSLAPFLVLSLAMLASAGLFVYSLKNAPLLWDEWGMVIRASDLPGAAATSPGTATEPAQAGNPIQSAFEPWNGHLIAFGILAIALLTSLFGLATTPFLALTFLGLVLLSLLLYFFSRVRIGPWAALLPALVPLFFAGGSEFFGTGLHFARIMGPQAVYSLLFGMGALILVERRSLRGDLSASLLLCLSLLFFSYGLAFIVGVGTSLLLSRRFIARSYVIAAPLILYVAWWLWVRDTLGGDSTGVQLSNLLVLPAYFLDSLTAVLSAFFGLTFLGAGPATTLQFGAGTEADFQLLGLSLLVVLLLALLLGAKVGPRVLKRPYLWPPLATVLALWTSQGLVAELVVRMPGSPRYLFAGAILITMVLVELLRGVSFSRSALVVVGGLTVVALLGNAYRFVDSKQLLDRLGFESGVVSTVLESTGPNSSRDFVPARDLDGFAPSFWIDARSYSRIVGEYGSFGYSPHLLRFLRPDQRERVDSIFAQALSLRLSPAPAANSHCSRLERGKELELLPGSNVLVGIKRSGLRLRRYGETPSVKLGTLDPGERAKLKIPPDSSSRRWRLATSHRILFCRHSTPN